MSTRKSILLLTLATLPLGSLAAWGANPYIPPATEKPRPGVSTPKPTPTPAPTSLKAVIGTPVARTSLTVAATEGNPQTAENAKNWAKSGWKAINDHLMSKRFWVKPPKFKEHVHAWKATVWPHSQALAAALDLGMLTGDLNPARDALKGLERFERGGSYNPNEGHGQQDRFYDDNAWIGLDFMQAYRQTGEKNWLSKAQGVFRFLQQGLHKDGGLYWKENEKRMSRNTASNGPALQLALQLYQQTGDGQYLNFARNLETFMFDKLRSPEGLFYDNLGDDGSTEKTIWSYNQGTMIGADVLFFEVTKDRLYLNRARQTADAALNWLSRDDALWKQPPAFNAVFFRNLLKLDMYSPNPRYREVLTQYLQRAMKDAWDSKTGLYGGGGLGKYSSGEKNVEVIDQAAFVQMHALLAMSKGQLAKLS